MSPLNQAHPVLVNHNITKTEKVKGFLEKYEVRTDVITRVALAAILGTALMATGTAPFIATLLIGLSVAYLIVVTIDGIAAKFIYHKQNSENSTTDLHLSVVTKKHYWLKASLNDPRIDATVKESKAGATALHLAVLADDLIATTLLLRDNRFQAQINERMQKNKAPAPQGSDNIADCLQEMQEGLQKMRIALTGGDLTKIGKTSLQLAILKHNLPMVQLLLDNGADPRIQDFNRENAAEFAARQLANDVPNRGNIIEVLNKALLDPKWNRAASPQDSKA